MICSWCGTECSDNSIYCSYCGKKFIDISNQQIEGNIIKSKDTGEIDLDIQRKQTKKCLILSVLCTLFCCFPFGIVGMIYSGKANTELTKGNIPKCISYSKIAFVWDIIGISIGVVIAIGYIISTLCVFFS